VRWAVFGSTGRTAWRRAAVGVARCSCAIRTPLARTGCCCWLAPGRALLTACLPRTFRPVPQFPDPLNPGKMGKVAPNRMVLVTGEARSAPVQVRGRGEAALGSNGPGCPAEVRGLNKHAMPCWLTTELAAARSCIRPPWPCWPAAA
jgi:hypothetical protein